MRLALAFIAFASPAGALPAEDCALLTRLNERYWLAEKALDLIREACAPGWSEACRRARIADAEIDKTPHVNALALALLIARECPA